MPQTQIKPVSGGSFNNVTGNGKGTTGIANLPVVYFPQVLEAVNLYAFTGGAAGARTTYATKLAAAAGRTLQWA